ncbi:hypothetical protein MGH68_00500 [Erysipelothrix sp. D19-032]
MKRSTNKLLLFLILLMLAQVLYVRHGVHLYGLVYHVLGNGQRHPAAYKKIIMRVLRGFKKIPNQLP